MYSFLAKLKNRSQELGNHTRKYVRSIDLYGEALVRRLEQRGMIDQVHLWKESRNPSLEMDVILYAAATREEKLNFLGCYYGIQFLHMNLQAIDIFYLNVKARQNRLKIFKEMQYRLGINFRRLNATYMAKLLELFLPTEKRPVFAVCGVGTRYDEDDLDLGIIDDGSSKRKDLNLAIGHLNSEMMKWAVPLHLHLSQYVGEPGFTASINEYQELLERQIHDFIIISEMLSAKLILGNESLFHEFEKKVTSRYYYHPKQDNLYHEGYLRGLLGEVRSLMLCHTKHNSIAPKEDAIRMIKGLIYCEKAMFSIQSANNYDILAVLQERDNAHRQIYIDLEKTLLFLETFRFLYQLLIIQDEEIVLTGGQANENLKIVARYMGYSGVGTINASEQLLIHYYENVAMAKEKTEQIFDVVTQHLMSISSFSRIGRKLKSHKQIDYNDKTNVAIEFAKLIEFFTGTKFWDDVINTLECDDAKLLQRLVNDIYKLDPHARQRIINKYVALHNYSFYGLLSMLLVIHRNLKKISHPEFLDELNNSLFKNVKGSSEEARRLAKVFSYSPNLINDYMATLSLAKQRAFIRYLQVEVWEDETAAFQRKLLRLAKLHCCASQYFKRFFQKAVRKYPECFFYLQEPATMKYITSGLLGEVDRYSEIKNKKIALGDYYNVEFMRTGIELLTGADFNYINSEFTEFSDTYLESLFDLCRMETDEEWAQRIATHDLLAIYVTGGHARGHAFDDDYDLIVVLNAEDEQIRHYSSRIISRMNGEIIKRGVLPHFRFSEYTGYFVTTMDELARILSNGKSSTFIDKAQLLGSRRVVGSSLFDKTFANKIIRPYIFEQKHIFIREMLEELRQRHEYHNPDNDGIDKNVKECVGGLRDIEMFFLILKAHFEIIEPISNELVQRLCAGDMKRKENYLRLKRHFDSLKHLRDIYRLTVTADDELDKNYLKTPAEILGFLPQSGKSAEENLLNEYGLWASEANTIIRQTFHELGIE